MKLIDAEHPFFRPLWRRIAVVAVCALWAAMEWATASPFWAVLASALGLCAFYALILTYDPARARPGKD